MRIACEGHHARRPGRSRRAVLAAALAAGMPLLFGCSPQPAVVVTAVATPSLTPLPSATPTVPPTPRPTTAPTAVPTPWGWETIADGVQIWRLTVIQDGQPGEAYALRLDRARMDVRLRLDMEQPRTVAEWYADEQPLAALNAGFFDQDNTPVGLWTIDGATYGRGHFRMQGEFRVTGAGWSIRRVDQRYLSDGTRVLAAIESYPFLILPGGVVNPCLIRTDRGERFGYRCAHSGDRAERLVVGIDHWGYLVFVLFPTQTLTLGGLADWLDRSPLQLDTALNLDGGSSAGMLVRAGAGVWGRDSGRKVPGAILVVPKVLGTQD